MIPFLSQMKTIDRRKMKLRVYLVSSKWDSSHVELMLIIKQTMMALLKLFVEVRRPTYEFSMTQASLFYFSVFHYYNSSNHRQNRPSLQFPTVIYSVVRIRLQ